jgi:hypothetical protein
MGMFAESAIVDYFIVCRPRKTNFRFRLPQTNFCFPFLFAANFRFPFPFAANFRFPFPFASNKRKFAVSVFRLQLTNGRLTNGSCRFPLVPFSVCGIPETWRHKDGDTRLEISRYKHKTWKHGEMETWTWRHGHGHGNKIFGNSDVIGKKENGFSLICLPFAHLANGRVSFVRLWTKKQTQVLRWQTD